MTAMLLGVRDAAKELGLGRDATYRLVRSGQIRSVQVGRKRLIPVGELTAWVERELEGHPPELEGHPHGLDPSGSRIGLDPRHDRSGPP